VTLDKAYKVHKPKEHRQLLSTAHTQTSQTPTCPFCSVSVLRLPLLATLHLGRGFKGSLARRVLNKDEIYALKWIVLIADNSM
jgi:hypothetical protein